MNYEHFAISAPQSRCSTSKKRMWGLVWFITGAGKCHYVCVVSWHCTTSPHGPDIIHSRGSGFRGCGVLLYDTGAWEGLPCRLLGVQARKEAAAAAAAAAAAGDDHPDRRVLAEREEACWLSRSSSRTSTRSRISNHYSDTYVLHSAVFSISFATSGGWPAG
jgi:hypothetical protein